MTVTRIIEGDKKWLTKEEMETINESFQAIEENFDNMTFTTQKFVNNLFQETIPFKLPKEALTHITVDLNSAYDEFWLTLKEPVIVQYMDNEPVYRDELYIEVVRDEIAESNDMDFLCGDYNEDTYKVGEADSYYLYVGEVEGTKYYYREL